MVLGDLGSSLSSGLTNSGTLGSTIAAKALPLMNSIGYGLKIVIYVGIFAAVGIFLYKFIFRYRDLAEMFIVSGSNIVTVHESRARVYEDKEDNTKRIELQKRYKGKRLNIPLIPGKFKYVSSKKDKYYLWLDDNFEPQPMEVKVDSLLSKFANKIHGGNVSLGIENVSKFDMVHMNARPQDRDAWRNMEVKKQRDKLKKEGIWDKYGTQIIMISSFAIAFLLFYFAFKELGTMGTAIGNGLQAVAEKCLGK